MADQMRYWRCPLCGACYRVDEIVYVCRCDRAGRLELVVELTAAAAVPDGEKTLWRYASLLPLDSAGPGAEAVRAGFPAGWTPLVPASELAARLGAAGLHIKDEAANPTGSLKDRASALVVAGALELGCRVVAAASTGNAAVALAAVARVVGMPCVVFVPARARPAQVRRLIGYGAHVVVVDGDYDTAVRLNLEACDAFGWYCRTTAVNPFTTQGKKTAGLEIAEQHRGGDPDVVVASVGDGNILVGLYQGLRDAVRAGWIGRMPRLVGVQARGASAVYRAWAAGLDEVPDAPAVSVAGGIAVGVPLDGARAVAAVRATGGAMRTVTDEEILGIGAELAALGGVTAEPSSAAAFAALPALDLRGRRVVVVNTGGAPEAPEAADGEPEPLPEPITPDLVAVRAALAAAAEVPTAVLPAHRRPGRLPGVSGT